ncbi:hypothetical protein [Tropicibacter sp. Alg240-R139]|uniref:hypothetical protein n=1 Tax=Tropicibacter sp. Alg240-R139 TaxID=2305991 RepID=UPI0013DF925A|nr:hypothetical protein [Tropicibacter sp. Alg240-R139]
MTPFLYPLHAQTAAIRMAGYALTTQIELLQAMSRFATLTPATKVQRPQTQTSKAVTGVNTAAAGRAAKVTTPKRTPTKVPSAKTAASKRKPVVRTNVAPAKAAEAAPVTKAAAAKPVATTIGTKTGKRVQKSAAKQTQTATTTSTRARRVPSRPPSMPQTKSQSDD